MMVYRCDRCGKIIEPLSEKYADKQIKRVIDFGYSSYSDPNDGGTVEQIDVCNSCYESFMAWKRMYQPGEKE